MPRGMRRFCSRLSVVALIGSGVACSDVELVPVPDAQAFDGGSSPAGPDAGTVAPTYASRVREDFANGELVASSSVAIIDINRGTVALPAETFPTITNQGIANYTDLLNYDGRVEASSIEVQDSAVIEAADSIELWASETVRIAGRIRAGPGGVNIVAGRGLTIDGVIESAGPVTLRLASEEGELNIRGRIETVVQDSRRSAPITLLARGSIGITGALITGGARYADTGGVVIQSYGKITVDGAAAGISSGPSEGGVAGTIWISTESEVVIGEGAQIRGGDSGSPNRTTSLRAGGIRIRGEQIAIRAATLQGGTATGGLGGDVELTSSGVVSVVERGFVAAGAGRVGGSLTVEAQSATVAVSGILFGGEGAESAGRVLVGTAGDFEIGDDAQIIGGLGRCGAGGAVVLLIGGRLWVTGQGARVSGGQGGADVGNACFGSFGGGHVQITAQDVIGPLDAIATGGAGSPAGLVSPRTDPSFTRSIPDIRVRTTGWVLSHPIDRGPLGVGRAPRLEMIGAIEPIGTFVKIQLSDADASPGETVQWIDLDADRPAPEALARVQRFRYRVFLKGRALDTPVLDYFEVNLAPSP